MDLYGSEERCEKSLPPSSMLEIFQDQLYSKHIPTSLADVSKMSQGVDPIKPEIKGLKKY